MRGWVILVILGIMLVSIGCVSNNEDLPEKDKLTSQLEEKDSKIAELSDQLDVKNKKVAGLSDQLVTKSEEIAKLSNNLSKKDNEILTLVQTKTELEAKIDKLESDLLHVQESDTTEFFKEYSIALINIHRATDYLTLAQTNLDFVEWYTTSEEYYYTDAELFYSTGKEYALDSRELLIKAKKKLLDIQDDAPNQFFKEDVENRIKQTEVLLLVVDNYYSLLDYSSKELYEINYGSETKAAEYYNKYADVFPELNANLKKLSDIQNTIDLEWDQDWYPTFQEEATESSKSKFV